MDLFCNDPGNAQGLCECCTLKQMQMPIISHAAGNRFTEDKPKRAIVASADFMLSKWRSSGFI